MFSLKEDMKFLKADPAEIEEVLTSVNAPFVAVPGYSSEATRAYICSLHHGAGRVSIYIYLHLTQSQKGLVYSYSKESLGPSEYTAARAEAMDFVESMGFIMEKAEFKGEAIDSLPPFMEDLSFLGKEEEEEVELTEISPEEPKKEVKAIKTPPKPEPSSKPEKVDIDIEVENPPEPVQPAAPRMARSPVPEESPRSAADTPRPQGKRVIGKIKLKDIIPASGEDKQVKVQLEAVIKFLSSL